MSVVARFYVEQFAKHAGGHATVTLRAVASKENAEWASYTPAGEIQMSLTRKAGGARRFFEESVGKELLLRFDLAEKPATLTAEFDELQRIWQENEAADEAELNQPEG